VLTRLWSGERVSFQGEHYRVDEVAFLPTPVQRPHVPIWVGGMWPNTAPFRRAARWDGAVPTRRGEGMVNYLSPEELREVVAFIDRYRAADGPFDVVATGHTAANAADRDTSLVRSYIDAGATWWLEDVSPWAFGWQWDGPWPIDQMNERIRVGPPRP
jgi:alkanesulfonate monooxygenase SsuD/methylene tetrahydromethanopterin reductase-like flavin-dependent oxidoreductase (luciferase family)